jgi:hypothetical protein
MKMRTKVGLIIAVLIIAVLIGILGFCLVSVLRDKYGVGVDSVAWLPAEARNITYVSSALTGRKAEFDIEQEAFEKWCARRKMPLRELGDEGYHRVFRCLPMLEKRGLIPAITESNDVERKQRETEQVLKHFRPGDLFYEKRWRNGGGYSIGYDVREKRGYYEYAHR